MGRLKMLPNRLSALPDRVKPLPKSADPFYQSAPWRGLVKDIKAQRGSWCERCGSTKGLIADHVIELKDGGAALDPSNVELLCARHHGAKTQAARLARAQGRVHGR